MIKKWSSLPKRRRNELIQIGIFTILAIIKPIRHISKMPPNLLKSIFVKYPINDIIANIPAVIKNVVAIEMAV